MKKFPTPEDVEKLRIENINVEEKEIILNCLVNGKIEYNGKLYKPTEIPWELIKNSDFPKLQEELGQQGWNVIYEEFDPCAGTPATAPMVQQICITPK
jgi:hypothetical protein